MSGGLQVDRPGEVASQISNRVVSIFKEYLGRGPTKARTTLRGDLVVCLLEDSLTKAERALVDSGKHDAVRALRRELQDTMEGDLRAVVEEATGRSVIAFMSANHIDPDYMSEIFVLDAEPDSSAPFEGGMLHTVPTGAEATGRSADDGTAPRPSA